MLDINRKELAQSEPRLVRDLVRSVYGLSPKAQCQATLALRNLAIDGKPQLPSPSISHSSPTAENHQLEIVSAGGLIRLLFFLQSAFPVLVLCAVACVHNVSIHPMNESPIIEGGFLPQLITLLSFDDREVQYHAIAILRHLASGSEENQLTIFKTGVVHSIKELVLEAPKKVQSEMAACVARLALNGVYPALDNHIQPDSLKANLTVNYRRWESARF